MSTYTAYNDVTIPSFMYGTAWKKETTAQLVQLAVSSGFKAIDTANQINSLSGGTWLVTLYLALVRARR